MFGFSIQYIQILLLFVYTTLFVTFCEKDRIGSQFFKLETNNGSSYDDEDHLAGKPKYLSTRLKEARRDSVERESKSNRLLTWFVIHGTKQRVRGRP